MAQELRYVHEGGPGARRAEAVRELAELRLVVDDSSSLSPDEVADAGARGAGADPDGLDLTMDG